ncbi:MAG: protein phosphatase 2C domain-containing protein [Kiritimatiellia bacterium]|jgi:protein phosphatase|nr:protein phosphatase 2C domain-containing protein [Kiritimatiellia bacterium]
MSNVFSHLSCAALTDQGRKRKNNEDAYAAFPESGVFCVADGMGGAEDGEVASQAVVEGLASRLGELAAQGCPIEGRSVQARIARTLNEVSSWIYARSEERGTRGTGTTFVGVCFDPAHPETATALHAGDSRLYLLRKRLFTQITRDHSAAALAGVKDEKDLNPMFRGIVMRAVGVNETVEVERTPFGIAEGDQILLCSDGLTRMVGDKEINKILRKAKTPEAAARELVDRANRNGGVDNVTVIVIRVGALPPAAACLTLAPEGERSAQETQDERVTRDATPAEEDTGATRNFAQGAATPSTPGSGDLLPFELVTPTPTPTPDARTPETVPEKKEAPGPVKPKKKRRRFAFMAAGAVLLLVSGGLWLGRRDAGVDPLASDVPERKPARGSDAVEDHAVRNEAARKVVEAERTATREAEEARRTEERRRAGEAARVAAAAEAAREAEEARRTEERRKAEEAARVAAAAEAAR